MSRGEILFRNQSGKRYMTKTVIGKPKSVHESLEDTLYDDIDDEDENIALKIKQAVAKLNSIRRACKEIDPDYDEPLLNAVQIPVTPESLDDLYDQIEEERDILNGYMQETQDEEDEFDNDIDEPTSDDINQIDDTVFDTPDDLDDDDDQPVSYNSSEFDDDDLESDFVSAMNYQMTNIKNEQQRPVFWLYRKDEPDTDYEVRLVTILGKTAFYFNIVSINGEEYDKNETIYLRDIDLEETLDANIEEYAVRNKIDANRVPNKSFTALLQLDY